MTHKEAHSSSGPFRDLLPPGSPPPLSAEPLLTFPVALSGGGSISVRVDAPVNLPAGTVTGPCVTFEDGSASCGGSATGPLPRLMGGVGDLVIILGSDETAQIELDGGDRAITAPAHSLPDVVGGGTISVIDRSALGRVEAMRARDAEGSIIAENTDADTLFRLERTEARAEASRRGDELARQLGCDATGDGAGSLDPSEPQPTVALACVIGDDHLGIHVFEHRTAVGAALAAVEGHCGYRVVGDNWIVVAKTRGSADAAHAALGGAVVRLSGCAGGG